MTSPHDRQRLNGVARIRRGLVRVVAAVHLASPAAPAAAPIPGRATNPVAGRLASTDTAKVNGPGTEQAASTGTEQAASTGTERAASTGTERAASTGTERAASTGTEQAADMVADRVDGIVTVRAATTVIRPAAAAGAARAVLTGAARVATTAVGRAGGSVRNRGGARSSPRGIVFLGTVWTGGTAEPFDGIVIVDGHGLIAACGPRRAIDLPLDLPTQGTAESWVGPGVCDAHVHLAFGGLDESLAAGLVAVRDLGAPPNRAASWRSGHRRPVRGHPFVAAAGPVLTATGGYPSQSWGAGGFAVFADTPADARHAVRDLAVRGADVIKIALEPGRGWPVMDPATVRAAVDTAHAAGLGVVAHALTVETVLRAVAAGVDELAHTPTERLDPGLVERIAERGVTVVSTLQTFFSEGRGRDAAANAVDLVEAGVVLRYGTDLGNAGTRPGVDPRELDRLADTGLGRLGALRAATQHSALAPGMRGRTGLLRVGEPAALVLLPADPLSEPGAWRAPIAVLADARLIRAEPTST